MQSGTFGKPEEVHWTRAGVRSMPPAVPGNEQGEMGGTWVFLVRSDCCRCDLHTAV